MSDEKNQAQTLYGRPDQMGKTPVGWRIELRYSDVAHRGHLFLRLVDPNDKAVAELHGLPKSKHQGTEDMQFDRMSKGMEDGSSLVVRHDDPSNLPVPGRYKGAPVSSLWRGACDCDSRFWVRRGDQWAVAARQTGNG